jgi:hypothetical protein
MGERSGNKTLYIFCRKARSEFIIDCDYAFLAMGFLHVQHKGLVEALDIQLDPRLNLIGNDTEYKTNQDKILLVVMPEEPIFSGMGNYRRTKMRREGEYIYEGRINYFSHKRGRIPLVIRPFLSFSVF